MGIHVAPMLLAATLTALGPPLRQEGFSVRPPDGFRVSRSQLFHGTRAGAVAMDPEKPRYLSAALTDGDGSDAASMIVTVVDEPLRATPAMRDAFSTAVVRHFSEELGMPLALERVELIREGAPRIEVTGTLKQQDQLRTVIVAGMEGDARHAVISFSIPTGRADALRESVRESLESFRAEEASGPTMSRRVAGALAVVAALALFASWSMWKRRRRLARAEQGLPG